MLRVIGILAIAGLFAVVVLVFVARLIVPGATQAQPQVLQLGTHVVEVPFFNAWAGSGHADIMAEAFRHWDEDGAVPKNCASCHTSGGFHDFLGADGSPAGTVEAEAQPSIITCAGCHNDTTAQLTNVTMPSGYEITGLGGEATCMSCHKGRESGVGVRAAIEELELADPDTVSEDLEFMQPHYFAAAATQYGSLVTGGFEYDGSSYDINFTHAEGYETCVGCHDPHSTEVRVESCSDCHEGVNTLTDVRAIRMLGSEADYDGDGDNNEGIRAEVEGVTALLLDQIQAYADQVLGTPIVHDPAGYPYFFVDTDANGVLDEGEGSFGNRYQTWSPRLVKAAFNYQLVTTDPGAYAHNAKYVIQLMHDSVVDLGEAIANGLTQARAPDREPAAELFLVSAQPMTVVDTSFQAQLMKIQQTFDTQIHRNDSPHFGGQADAFRHWDEDGAVPGSCSRCHSASGLPLFLADGATISQPPSNGLRCSTCHTDLVEFGIYEPEETTYPSGATLSFAAPESNLCATCHQGRASGQSIVRAVAGLADDEVSEGLRFINPHYFAAAATRWGTEANGMFEYPDQEYAGLFDHADGPNQCHECHDVHTQEVKADPCAECHENKDTTEELVTIRSLQGDFDGDGNADEGIAEEIETMEGMLYTALQDYARDTVGTPIVYDSHSYPYFFVDGDGDGEVGGGEAIYPNRYQTWTPRLLRAAYNFQYVQKDPGGYAHNGLYMLQALYDSLADLGVDVSQMRRASIQDYPREN